MLRGFLAGSRGVDVQRLKRERTGGLEIAKPMLMVDGQGLSRLAKDSRGASAQVE